MSLTRRELLERTAATPLLLGLSSLRAAASPGKPSWFEEALARMAEQGAWGVAIPVAEEPGAREALARSLEAIARGRSWVSPTALVPPGPDASAWETEVEVVELLLEAEYCCVPPGLVPSRDGETAVLLDPGGTRVAGRAVDFSSDARFAEGMGELLHGEGRLESRAAAARTGQVAALLDRFAAHPTYEDPRDPSFIRDRGTLIDVWGRGAPAYWLARRRSEDFRFREFLLEVLRFAMYRRLEEKRPGAVWYEQERTPQPASRPRGSTLSPRGVRCRMRLDGTLPFGVIWEQEWVDTCPPCGMGSVPIRSRKFLRFLTE